MNRVTFDDKTSQEAYPHEHGSGVVEGLYNILRKYEQLGYTPEEIKIMLECGARAAGFPLEYCLQEDE